MDIDRNLLVEGILHGHLNIAVRAHFLGFDKVFTISFVVQNGHLQVSSEPAQRNLNKKFDFRIKQSVSTKTYLSQ